MQLLVCLEKTMHANWNKVDGGCTLCPFNFVIEGTIFEAIAFSMQAD